MATAVTQENQESDNRRYVIDSRVYFPCEIKLIFYAYKVYVYISQYRYIIGGGIKVVSRKVFMATNFRGITGSCRSKNFAM